MIRDKLELWFMLINNHSFINPFTFALTLSFNRYSQSLTLTREARASLAKGGGVLR